MHHFSTGFKTINCLLKEILQFEIKYFKPFSNLNMHNYLETGFKSTLIQNVNLNTLFQYVQLVPYDKVRG